MDWDEEIQDACQTYWIISKTNIGDGKLQVGTLNNHFALKSINDYRIKPYCGTCKQTHFQKIPWQR